MANEVVQLELDAQARAFLADRFRVYQYTGGKLTYSAYAGQFVSNMIDELIGDTK